MQLNFNDEFRYEATYLIYKIFQRQKIVQAQVGFPKIFLNHNP